MNTGRFSRQALIISLLFTSIAAALFYRSQRPTNLFSNAIYTEHLAKIEIDQLSGELQDPPPQDFDSATPVRPISDPYPASDLVSAQATLQKIQELTQEAPRQRFYVTQLVQLLHQEPPPFQGTKEHPPLVDGRKGPSLLSNKPSQTQWELALRLLDMIRKEQDRLISMEHEHLQHRIHIQATLWRLLTGLCLLSLGFFTLGHWETRKSPNR